MEKTNTTGIEIKPKGKYILEIERVIKSMIGKDGGKQYPGYKWFFIIRFFDGDIDIDNFNMFMFKSQMGEILRAIGAKEVEAGVFEWELADAKGKIIECHLEHVDIGGKLREQLIEVKEYDDVGGFPESKLNKPSQENSGEEVAWDE